MIKCCILISSESLSVVVDLVNLLLIEELPVNFLLVSGFPSASLSPPGLGFRIKRMSGFYLSGVVFILKPLPDCMSQKTVILCVWSVMMHQL